MLPVIYIAVYQSNKLEIRLLLTAAQLFFMYLKGDFWQDNF